MIEEIEPHEVSAEDLLSHFNLVLEEVRKDKAPDADHGVHVCRLRLPDGRISEVYIGITCNDNDFCLDG